MGKEEDYRALLSGLQKLDFRGPYTPSALTLTGSHAFPLAMNAKDQVLMAASRYGHGRIVVLGHEKCLEEFPDMVRNAVNWLKSSNSRSKVGINMSCNVVVKNLQSASIQAEVCAFRDELGVYVTDAYSVDPHTKDLVSFLKDGGGLLVVGQAWWWAKQNPEKNLLLEFPGNKVCNVAGIYFSEHYGELGTIPVPPQIPSSWLAVSTAIMEKEVDYRALLSGLQKLDFRGPYTPSALTLTGSHAFPLAMNAKGQVLMAASRYGHGRIVVLGHEKCLEEFPDMVRNAVNWLKSSNSRSKVGINMSCNVVVKNLQSASHQAEVCAFRDELGVYVTDAYSVGSYTRELVSFLKDGGGLLVVGQAWWWATQNQEKNLLVDFPGNKVCSVAGIYLSEHCGELGTIPVPPQIPSSWLAVSTGKNFKEDLETLLSGVSEFDTGDLVASQVLVHGPLSFPIGTTPDDRVFIAGAVYGQGRVIVLSHDRFLGCESMASFLINAIRWLDDGRSGLVGIGAHLDKAHKLLSNSKLTCQMTGFRKDLSVYVCTSYNDAQHNEILEFVAEGKGLLIGGHAWHWVRVNLGGNVMTEYPGNRLLNKMGLSILGNFLSSGLYKAPDIKQVSSESYHFRGLLRSIASNVLQGKSLTEQDERCLKKLSTECFQYLAMQPHECATYSSVVALLTSIVKEAGIPQVSPTNPIKSDKERFMLCVGAGLYKNSSDPEALLPCIIKEHPALPTVANASIYINVNIADEVQWISTGLYLSPGMKTQMTMPTQIVGKGWAIQIGCQTDDIGGADVLKRAPVVHELFPVEKERIQVWNLWGGLIYLVAPPNSREEGLKLVVQTAVRAPYFQSGKTGVQEWVSSIRSAPAPWAELEFENIIMTIQSEGIRGLERPDEVARLWDDIMRAVADLAAIPAKFPRKERFVADVQITAGFMHSGYPIMMLSQSGEELLNPEEIRKKGVWGQMHELGHNQQRDVWEFKPHTTECTCNLWALYVHDKVIKLDRTKAHEEMKPENRNKHIQEYVKGGRQLGKWTKWTALETFLQLQAKFGWSAFKKVFAAYHHMSNVPRDNQGKMNKYAETFSTVVNRNLAPFFKAWGWPIESAVEKKLSSLPEWSDHPMAQYA
ncbi:TRPM8 channel-associated factor homolog [Denticeps clupeoides]|uniref:Peptidase M60 domain-containing protein n=1 Tax=Denticeps clupeoides TaxID=299321 RepID=A0AAY4CCR4_9TELE|nr:TRPM8 channel-associated factor homolog [Denticeps clupeoides]XP_028817789.1 TRPM8 channel-associated factor homolog [Denticeps clupeoides]